MTAVQPEQLKQDIFGFISIRKNDPNAQITAKTIKQYLRSKYSKSLKVSKGFIKQTVKE